MESEDNEEDAKPVLLSLEDQISLQETVQGLLEENKKLKKKAADADAAKTTKAAAPTLKKMKNKVGRKVKKEFEEQEEVVKSKSVVKPLSAMASEPVRNTSTAMDLGDLYAGHTVYTYPIYESLNIDANY